MSEITQLLKLMGSGDVDAEEQLLRIVYDELKRIAASKLSRERPGHTLQTTALVNEAYMRLVGNKEAPKTDPGPSDESENVAEPKNIHWDSRGHFFASAAEAMRRILIDNARRKKTHKRGGDNKQVPLEEVGITIKSNEFDLESLDQALSKLEKQDSQHAAVVKLKYFTGLTIEQIADALGVSPATVKRSWVYSKAWLRREIGDSPN